MMSPKPIDWSEPQLIDTDTFPADKLDREKYAEFLTHFLAAKGFDPSRDESVRKHHYVLNLNSEWGSGKTYFLRRWAEDLKSSYPVVYVDAWKQDYSDDPLMTVVSSMIKQLKQQARKDAEAKTFQVSRKLIGLLKAAAPGIARGLASRYLGIDPLKIIETQDDNYIESDEKDADGKPINMGLAAAKIVEQLIHEHDAKAVAIDSLKTNVKQWVEAVVGIRANKGKNEPRNYPAFVFIDELDRCRPSYAVEMLETIKHIFDIPGVVFVVATDTEQLQHTVKAVYGEGFDARTYLGRFFNSRYTLKAPSYKTLLSVHCDMTKLSADSLVENNIKPWPELYLAPTSTQSSLDNLTVVYEALALSARQVIRVTERLISTVENLKPNTSINLIYLAFLLSLREKHPHLYDEMLARDLNSAMKSAPDKPLLKELDKAIGWKTHTISLYLRPATSPEQFPIKEHESTRKLNNIFPDSYYEISLYHFIDRVHKHFLSPEFVNNNAYQESLTTLKQQVEQKHQQNMTPRQWAHHSSKFASQWVCVLTAENNKKETKTGKPLVSYYQDLVELASALDWGDEEALASLQDE